MATVRTTGELITATIWNGLFTGLTDDGLTYSGAVVAGNSYNIGYSDVYFSRSGAGKLKAWNGTSGVVLDVSTANTLKVRNIGDSADGDLQAATGTFSTAAVAPFFRASSATKVTLSTDGIALFSNNAATGFTRIILGTNDTSGVALKKNSTALNVRLGDDSADAAITAAAGTFSGVLSVTSTSDSSFSSGINSAKRLVSENTTSGTGAYTSFRAIAGTTIGSFYAFSQGYTSSNQFIASSVMVDSESTGGLTLSASNAAGFIRFYTVSSERMRIFASGGVNIGATTDPGAGALYVSATGNTYSMFGASLIVQPLAVNNQWVSDNIYYDGSFRYKVNGSGVQVYFNAGNLGIYFTGAGTAGNVATMTERVRFHASGGVSVGDTTDPGATNFRVAGTSALVGNVTASAQVLIKDGTSGSLSLAFSAHTTTGFYYNSAGIGGVVGGTDLFFFGGNKFQLSITALGTGNVQGPLIVIGNNSSGNGAAGSLALYGKGSAANYLWADASAAPGMLRISTVPPDEDGTPSDTSGTIVGTQTSTRDTKNIVGLTAVTPKAALAAILSAPVFDFTAKGGAYSGTLFTGLTVDDSKWIGMDPDERHPHGRSFNPVTTFGYTVLAFKALEERLRAAEHRIDQLQGRGGVH